VYTEEPIKVQINSYQHKTHKTCDVLCQQTLMLSFSFVQQLNKYCAIGIPRLFYQKTDLTAKQILSVHHSFGVSKHTERKTYPKMAVTYSLLKLQNAETSNALIEEFSTSEPFLELSRREGDLILNRDQEDAEKLQVGIDYAKEKGVIDPDFVPEPYVTIDVLGKSPDAVSDEIIRHVNENNQDGGTGSVIVLCGLSGTGKGTTVAKLSEKLATDRKVVCWSNGNIFRSVTLLAATWCEQQDDCNGFDAERALTKENLASFMKMLSFDKFNGKFDTRINGLGIDVMVSEVQNTMLKEPKVAKNIPTVAEVTQGEVITFAAEAIKLMSADGVSILLEGREQTVNYVRTPLRFILTLSDETLIGKRRAAQRLMAAALDSLEENATDDQVKGALDIALEAMLKEHES
jgi:cytidylate kinase